MVSSKVLKMSLQHENILNGLPSTVDPRLSGLPGGDPCTVKWIFRPSKSYMLSGNFLVELTISAQVRKLGSFELRYPHLKLRYPHLTGQGLLN